MPNLQIKDLGFRYSQWVYRQIELDEKGQFDWLAKGKKADKQSTTTVLVATPGSTTNIPSCLYPAPKMENGFISKES